MGKNIAVVLSGCGVYDGAEIQEAVLSMYSIKRYGASYQVFAPNINQHHVINHLTGEEMNETRNVMVESARIARGNVLPIEDYEVQNFDALLFPGGFGAAKNLSSYAFKGANMEVLPSVKKVIQDTHAAGKPIGVLCIAPVLIAKIIVGAELTIGVDTNTSKHVEEMGAVHKNTSHAEVIYDSKNKIISSPCYMLDATIDQIGAGADKVVAELVALS
jgi:enhancing lycopene biosynthesis protein 2